MFYKTDENFQKRFDIEEPKVKETLRGDEWEELLDKWFSSVNNALYTQEKESEEIGLMIKQFRPENITVTVKNSVESNNDTTSTMGRTKNLSINVQDDKRTVCFQDESSNSDEIEILEPEIFDVEKTEVDPDVAQMKEEILDVDPNLNVIIFKSLTIDFNKSSFRIDYGHGNWDTFRQKMFQSEYELVSVKNGEELENMRRGIKIQVSTHTTKYQGMFFLYYILYTMQCNS